MSGDKVCNKCKAVGLGWDKEFHEKYGKWKLEDHKTKTGSWCNKMMSKNRFASSLPAVEIFPCAYCLARGHMFTTQEELEDHVYEDHPNGEEMTALDEQAKYDKSVYWMVPGWVHDKHFYKYIPKLSKGELKRLREFIENHPKYEKLLEILP